MSWPEYIIQIEPHEEGELYHMRGEPNPIVRCRDCKYAYYDECPMYDKQQPNGFCAWGKRK